MALPGQYERVLSGMRPSGRLHLGHYHGVLKNWINLQHEYDSYFFVADWHALTTHYDTPEQMQGNVWDMVIDWLAAGVDPSRATIFIQSQVPEHAELHLLLSMITPVSWLERVPSYKEQQEKLSGKDLSTYGFLGYPLLQSADILIYNASYVPVGDDQVAHVELTREIARRFNFIYGRDEGFIEKAESAIDKMGKKNARQYRQLRTAYIEQGQQSALEEAHQLLNQQQNITIGDKERLFGYLEGGGRVILTEPEALLTSASRMTGLDGQKMSKSYNNTIFMRDDNDRINKEIRAMPTDPARVRRDDPGDPEKCPVWELHKIYSDDDVKSWVVDGCKTAGIGCVDCKKPLIDSIIKEQDVIKERARPYVEDPTLVRNVIASGCEKASEVAEETMEEVRDCLNTDYYS